MASKMFAARTPHCCSTGGVAAVSTTLGLVALVSFFTIAESQAAGEIGEELQPPVKVTAAGAPIDVQRIGHSAPFYGDFDGDGVKDLLVGQFFEGRLRVYRNVGTEASPRFDDFAWFKRGADGGCVPVG